MHKGTMAGAALALGVLSSPIQAQTHTGPKVTWHWHQHQPIYWNDQWRGGSVDRYEYAYESIVAKNGGAVHPTDDIHGIFGKDDRVAAYQYRMRDALGSIGGYTNSGASVSYSGALMENVNSLGQAYWGGYSPAWKDPIAEANGWTTTGGAPRLDLVNFTFHHSLTGLHNPETIYMEIRLHQEKVKEVFGEGALSKGLFPTEMTFSTRLIPTLVDLGIEWSLVSGEHVARACPDFPLVLGSGGVNCAPPNLADQINPNGEDFIRTQISRGCAPVQANPLSFQPAYAQYVDPETGEVDKLIVVPVDQGNSWQDGYQCHGAEIIDRISDRNDPSQPSIVVLCHDGDNAFAGGFSYYSECVSGMAGDASNRGAEPTSIQQYLAAFPPDPDSVIHVEDGGWVNADSDFGSPSFINWNYPLITPTGEVDPVNGWHEKARDMAIFTAALNRILTAQQIHGHIPDFGKILHPDGSTWAIDRAWHYYLGSLDSGNVYFGPAQDLEVKATIGCNEAMEHVDPLLTNLSNDLTAPTIWLPQRFPYNPGSVNYGVEFGYRQFVDDGDFHIWTFIADPSGPVEATLKYRIDEDGTNPLDSIQNETFAGGAEVGDWVSLPMNRREFPKDQPEGYNNGQIDFFELPTHISDHFSVEVVNLREVLIDYYVEAVDSKGNVAKSPIQHVYIGNGEGSDEGGGAVTVEPDPPVRGESVTITYDATDRPLHDAGQVYIHLGKNDWDELVEPDPAMTSLGNRQWEYVYTIDGDAMQIDMVFNNGSGTWDNNGGADWHFNTVEGGGPPAANFVASPVSGRAPLEVSFTDTSTGSPTAWEWDFDNDGSTDSTDRNPTHTYQSEGSYTVALTVTNAEGSDTRTRADYIDVSPAPTEPEILLSRSAIVVTGEPEGSIADEQFTVTNTGVGSLNYEISAGDGGVPTRSILNSLLGVETAESAQDINTDSTVDAADVVANPGGAGLDWISVAPGAGSSEGESDTITVSFDTAGLSEGEYSTVISVTGNAPNSPQTIDITLTITEEVPTATSVVPNPPVADAQARVWYVATGGPISGATTVVLHWGINAGTDPGGSWEQVTDTAMTESSTARTWYADIGIPAGATSLNFVVNDGNENWDNNGGLNWNFLTAGR